MNLPKFSISQPVLVNMALILVLVAGFGAFSTMIKEEWPDIGSTHALVTVSYPGASPREVEKLVIVPIEEQIEAVQEIDTVTSVSSEGRGRVFVEFDANVSDYDLRLQELQREVGATPDLPEDADDPVVTSFRFGNSRVMNLALVGTAPEHVVQERVKALEDELKRVKGVERVETTGKREREIWVEIDPHRLHSYGLSLQDVITTLRRSNENVPGGTVESGPQEFVVRTVGEAATIPELNQLVVKRDAGGQRVYLGDVATLRDTFEDPITLGRINGRPSVGLEIHKVVGGDTLQIVDRVQSLLDDFRRTLPPGLDVVIYGNTADDINARLDGLYQNGTFGLFLVLVSLYIFVGVRPAIMTALGIPFTLALAFTTLHVLGFTINTITLFSLIIVLGMIVDDGIVITENVYRYYEQGESRTTAVVRGVNEVLWPVIAAVATTIAAFLPLMLMTGWLGKYMAVIPETGIIALTASLMECLFILPSHLYDFPPRRAQQAARTRESGTRRAWLRNFRAAYARGMRWALRHRYTMLVGILALAWGAVWLAQNHVDLILFGGRDASEVEVSFDVIEGTRLEETMRAAGILEAEAMALPDNVYDFVFANVGTKGWRDDRAYVSNAGRIEIDLSQPDDREMTSKDVMRVMREVAPRYPVLRNVVFEEDYEGPRTGEAVRLDISGPDMDTLRELSGQVQAYLGSVDGVYDVSDNYLPGKPEVQIIVDEEKAHLSSLDRRTVADTARAALFGVEATTFYDHDDDVPVRVRYQQQARRDFTDLSWLEIVNERGERVPFTNVARIDRVPGLARIYRYQGERTVTVKANVDETVTTSQAVNDKLKARFEPSLAAYPGYAYHFGGEYEETNESVASLRQAFLIGITLIYMILGTQFKSFIQPLVVMTAVPFSLIGVVLGFFLLDEPLGMMSLIGTVALAGIVVNDSLILVDFINRARASGMGKYESIIRSGSTRLRPILLTSITTIVGVMPIAFGLFGTDQFLRPMAIAIGWGLTFATMLTLGIVPVFYTIVVDDVQPQLARLAAKVFRLPTRVSPPAAEAGAGAGLGAAD